jgi:hypothetical protein
MNLDHLAKLYDRLTPRERLPLIIAAGARGDATEQQRLSTSAPKQRFEVSDYYPLAKALGEAVHYHLLTLLDLAANFWQWWGLWMGHGLTESDAPSTHKGRRRRATADLVREWRAYGVMRYYAARFVAHVDGWKQFCTELTIDPEVQLNFMIGWDTIQRTEKQARELAFDPEEAARFVRLATLPVEGNDSLESGPQPVETVAGLAAAWHILLDQLTHKEGGV